MDLINPGLLLFNHLGLFLSSLVGSANHRCIRDVEARADVGVTHNVGWGLISHQGCYVSTLERITYLPLAMVENKEGSRRSYNVEEEE